MADGQKKVDWANDEGPIDVAQLAAQFKDKAAVSSPVPLTAAAATEHAPAPATAPAPTQEVKVEWDSPLVSATSFAELGLREELIKGIFSSMGWDKPSRIQGIAIPILLKEPPQNFIGQAQTGTGKTAAFSLPMLQRIDENDPTLQGLILAPTRELARQINDDITKLASFTKIKILLAVPSDDKSSAIPKKIDHHIMIGSPGTVMNLTLQHKNLFNKVKMFVLDEADHMLSAQGLKDQALKVQKKLPRNVQVALFSATFDGEVLDFAEKIAPPPHTKISIPKEQLSKAKIAQFFMDCGKAEERFVVLDKIYENLNVAQTIIFVQTRDMAKKLAEYMKAQKHEVSLLHGADMDAKERDRVIDAFRKSATRVLITTNVLARGVDVPQVSMVVNFDVPVNERGQADAETYYHRIGRTGRYDKSGLAITFVHDARTKAVLDQIASVYNTKIEQLPIDKLDKLAELLSDFAD